MEIGEKIKDDKMKQHSDLVGANSLFRPRMTPLGVEDLWGQRGDLFEEEEILGSCFCFWTEVVTGGRATLSIQGFDHFLKPEIFRGDPTHS